MKKLIFSVHEKHQAYGRSGIQEAVGFVSDSFKLGAGGLRRGLTNPNSWYPLPERAMILSAICRVLND